MPGSMMPLVCAIAIGTVLAYFVGAIPTGVIVSKSLLGIDIRKHGSGNVGTTNAMRTGGFKTGALVCVLDILKGVVGTLVMLLVVVLARTFFADAFGPDVALLGNGMPGFDTAMGIAQVAAVVGHMHSPFMGFKGGKGIATAFGTFLVVVPWCALVAVIAFALGVLITRYASIGSMAGAVGYGVSCTIVYLSHVPLVVAAWVIFALVVFAHRGNIVRLARGEEPKSSIGSKETIESERLEEQSEQTEPQGSEPAEQAGERNGTNEEEGR